MQSHHICQNALEEAFTPSWLDGSSHPECCLHIGRVSHLAALEAATLRSPLPFRAGCIPGLCRGSWLRRVDPLCTAAHLIFPFEEITLAAILALRAPVEYPAQVHVPTIRGSLRVAACLLWVKCKTCKSRRGSAATQSQAEQSLTNLMH